MTGSTRTERPNAAPQGGQLTDADLPNDGALRVLVVDDHSTFAELLTQAIDREPDLVSVEHCHPTPARGRMSDAHQVGFPVYRL